MAEFMACPLHLDILLSSSISRTLWSGVKSIMRGMIRLCVLIGQDLFASVDVVVVCAL